MEENNQEILILAKKLKNQHSRDWRKKNKDKVKLINQRYWINKAKKLQEKRED